MSRSVDVLSEEMIKLIKFSLPLLTRVIAKDHLVFLVILVLGVVVILVSVE